MKPAMLRIALLALAALLSACGDDGDTYVTNEAPPVTQPVEKPEPIKPAPTNGCTRQAKCEREYEDKEPRG